MAIYKNRSDLHSHSSCSFDGNDSMEAMCERAIAENLAYYGITDHCECNKYFVNIKGDGPYSGVAKRAYGEMEKCREQFPQLRFLRGIELGQPLQDLEAAEDALSGRDYDVVIGSLHNVSGYHDFYHLGEEKLTPQQLNKLYLLYFSEIEEMIEWGKFDTLAHIFYPMRYIKAEGEASIFTTYHEQFCQVLKSLISHNKALEFNTSRLLKASPKFPDLQLFSLYKELGGKLITIGSDAHCALDVAGGVNEAMEILSEAGFSEYAVYVNHKPVMLPIE